MRRFSFILICSVLMVSEGCGKSSPPAGQKSSVQTSTEHDHHGTGPHGGTVSDWGGGKYHVEFTVDHSKKESTVYILGSDEKTPAPVKASKLLLSINDPAFQVELAPQPLENESDGSSSRFVGQHDSLGKVQEFAGTISAEVEGTPYAGDFNERPHKHSSKD